MNVILKEWIEKAEEDYGVALREIRARKNPALNAVCFHAQQCVEKYLKAVHAREGVPFIKTHDLDVLLTGCTDRHPFWAVFRDDLKRLSRYAVQFRYPGESADREEAIAAVAIMKRCRSDIRAGLGLRDKEKKRGH